MSKMSEIHITLSNSHTRSRSTVELLCIDPATKKKKRVMLARYIGFSREEAADALHHWRENNERVANNITLTRVEWTTMY